ncbi:hypothetical protein Chor_008406 [Crotalus horridus]
MLPAEEMGSALPRVSPSPEPSMYRHRPASELTQDISHVLTKVFKSLYTSEVIAADMVDNMIKSHGGNNPHHKYFVEELRKSTFRWCVDSALLKKHHLICPDDYITDPVLVTHAPKDVSEPGYLKETDCKHYVPPDSEALQFKESSRIKKLWASLPDVSLSSLTLESSDINFPDGTMTSFHRKKSRALGKPVWMDEMSSADREKDRLYLQKLKERHNFLKNPRFFPPNTLHGGKSLILPQKKVERMIGGRRKFVMER